MRLSLPLHLCLLSASHSAGSLDYRNRLHACRHAFQHYISQDAFFLKAFAQAYALALCQTAVVEERQTLQSLLEGVDKELELHKAYTKAGHTF